MVGNSVSDFFTSSSGVRQGENLSPLLFALYINDLESFLGQRGCEGATINSTDSNSILCLQFLLLLYADDTVLFGETPLKLQKSINEFYDYCNTWKLNVNLSKTKILIFGSCSSKKAKDSFFFGNNAIEIVDSYVYLGINFHRNRRLLFAMRNLATSATKAMFALLKRSRNINLALDSLLKAFDVLIAPILMYGSEIWGYENLEIIEKVHLKFLKLACGLRQSTPNFMVYGELGRFPLAIAITKRLIHFWLKLETPCSKVKLSTCIYNFCKFDYNTNPKSNTWLKFVRSTLDNCGLSYVYNDPRAYNIHWVVHTVERTLKDQFLQNWQSNIKKTAQKASTINFSNKTSLLKIIYSYLNQYPYLSFPSEHLTTACLLRLVVGMASRVKTEPVPYVIPLQ